VKLDVHRIAQKGMRHTIQLYLKVSFSKFKTGNKTVINECCIQCVTVTMYGSAEKCDRLVIADL